MTFFAVLDLTIPRLKRGLLLGTRWGQPDAPLVPAPGDPYYLRYTYDPLMMPVTPPAAPVPQGGAPTAVDGGSPSPQDAPRVPGEAVPTLPGDSPPPIFAGPYGEHSDPAAPTGGG
jgi:phospholipid/cholesterol/gamma-HCH transport system substrate-binding protein